MKIVLRIANVFAEQTGWVCLWFPGVLGKFLYKNSHHHMVKWDKALDTLDFTTRKSPWRDHMMSIIHIFRFWTWGLLHMTAWATCWSHCTVSQETCCVTSGCLFPSPWNSTAYSDRRRRIKHCAGKHCFWITLLRRGIFLTFRAADFQKCRMIPPLPFSAFLRATKSSFPFHLPNPLLKQLNQIKPIVIIFAAFCFHFG